MDPDLALATAVKAVVGSAAVLVEDVTAAQVVVIGELAGSAGKEIVEEGIGR